MNATYLNEKRTFTGRLDVVISNDRIVIKWVGADGHKGWLWNHANLNWLCWTDQGNAYAQKKGQQETD